MRGSFEGRPFGLAAQETADSISVIPPDSLLVRLAALILATADATGQRECLPGPRAAPRRIQRLSAGLDPSEIECLLRAARRRRSYLSSGRGRVFQFWPAFEA